MYNIQEKINKFKEVFKVDRVQGRPVAIEDAMSRTNQRFWRVKLDTGDTLYTYQRSTIGSLLNPDVPGQPTTLLPTVVGQICVFDLEQKGKYFHIVASGLGGQPTAVAPPSPTATPTRLPGTPVMAPGGYPATWDQSQPSAAEQTMQDIATPQATPAPMATQVTPQVTTSPSIFKSSGDGKNASVCMSYAKDLAVAGVIKVEQMTAIAETMFQWVEAHK